MVPEIVTDMRLGWALLAPLLGALLVMRLGKFPNLREAASLAAALVLFGTLLTLVPQIRDGIILQQNLFQLLPGLSITLRADGLSLIFALVAALLWIVAIFYSAGYMRGLGEHEQTRFNACFALALFGAMGCAFADNLFTLYLFYEIVSIVTYPLVAHHQDKESYGGARKYLVYLTATAKGLVLPAMILIYVWCGTLDFAIGIHDGILPTDAPQLAVTVLYFCLLFGFAKNGLMPLHGWLPSAMVAPTPVSALLHAVAVVKVGVFATVRVMLYVFGTDTMELFSLGLATAWLASVTILVASVIALTKDNLKARLAYSTVSQLAYIILGAALLAPLAIEGGILHIAHHAFAKITLFFCAGAIYVASYEKNISGMAGMGRQLPWTFGAFGVAALSMIGVPPVGGFVTKWAILNGAYGVSAYGIIAVLLISTLLNAAYFIPVITTAFFGKADPQNNRHAGIKPERKLALMVVPLCITAALSVLVGLYPDFFLQFARLVTSF